MDKISITRNLKEYLHDLNTLDFDRLLKTHKLGGNSLIEFKSTFIDLVSRLKLIIENYESISYKSLKEIENFYTAIYSFIQSTLTISDKDFLNQRANLANEIIEAKDRNDEIWEQIAGIVKSKANDLALEEQIKNINLVNDQLQQRSQDQINQIENIKSNLEEQFEEFKTRYSPLNASVEIENQKLLYETEAKKNADQANDWRNGIIISLLLLFAIIIYFFYSSKDDLQNLFASTFADFNVVCISCGQELLWFYLIKIVLLKALFISINIYILRFCIKNYNAAMHNKTVNKQRQNSLGAALHFYNNIVTDRKDEILVLAANSIFAHQKTGYIEKGSEPANPVVVEKILEKVNSPLTNNVI